MVKEHEILKVRRMVIEEERWFLETENELIDECSKEKIATVRKFKELIWTRGSDEVVLSS